MRQSGEDIKNKLLQKAKNGGTVGRAKLGYVNARKEFDGRLVNTIDVDTQRAPFIRWAFAQYARGDRSISQLLHELSEQGLTARKSARWSEKSISRSLLSLILRDPYYIGMVTFRGQLYPGRHEPLISTELFERVQRVTDARMKRGQLDIVHNHFLRGLMYCGRCHDAGREHRLIYSEAKNHADQTYEYFLGRGRQEGHCDLPYLPAREIEHAIGREFAAQALSPAELDLARERVSEALEQSLASQLDQQKRLQKELDKLDTREERLVDLAANGSLPTSRLRERLRDVQVKKHRVRDRLADTADDLQSRTEAVLAYLELLQRPEALFATAAEPVKRQLLAAFFSRIWIDDDGHQLTVSTEFQPLLRATRDVALAIIAETKRRHRRYLWCLFYRTVKPISQGHLFE